MSVCIFAASGRYTEFHSPGLATMAEIRDELDGEPQNQDIRVYVNAKTDAFCTDLIFPFGIPANGVISLFVGDFSASYSRDRCEHPDVADKVIKQRLVAICRQCQGKPMCVPVPCRGSSEDSVEQSHEATVSPQDLLESVWKEAKSTTDRLTVSAAHLRLPGTEIDDLPFERDFEDFAVGSPVPSVGDASACLSRSESPVDPELPHIIDLSAPAFHLFSTSEESEDDSPCVKRRRNSRSRREAAVSSPEAASVHEPVGDEDVDEFICGICDKSFQARLLCKRHVWGHLRLLARSRSFKCPACTKAFCSGQAQRYHYKTKHMGDDYKKSHMCSQCSASFETLTMLSQHVRNVHTACIKVYTCEYCLCLFQKQCAYKTHVAKKHQDGMFEMLSRSPEAELRCFHCPSFITSSDMVLTQHLRSEHSEAKTFGCSMCSLIFQDEKDQEEHEQTWHTVKLDHRGSQIVYICFFCDKRITKLRSLSEHLRLHIGQREKSFLCPKCGAQLGSATTLRIHMMLHEEKSFQCPHCPRQFSARIYVRKHIWRCHNAELRFSCSHCGKKFLTTKDIQRHLATMHIDDLSPDEMALVSQLKKYPCELCPFVAYDHKGVGAHMSDHPEAQWIKCRRCSRYFKTEAELLAHDARSHKTTFVRRPCQLCTRIFYSDTSFEEHAQLHADGNGMMCLQCNMLFRTSVELERHAECHDPALTKTCGDCGRTFASLKSLQMHQRLVHLKGRKQRSRSRQSCHASHQCPHCQQHFQFASDLQAHIVYRHNHADSPSASKLPCPICGKLCSSQVTMSMHLRIHLNEQPYMCECCDKTFTTFGAAKAHNARHLTMKNFPCDRCSKQFIQQKELVEHVRTTHPEHLETELSISHDAGQLEMVEEEEVMETFDHFTGSAHSSMPQLCL